MSRAREVLGTFAAGGALGFVLSRIGFSSWDEVHRMFLFADLRLVLVFGMAVALLVPVWPLLQRLSARRWPERTLHKGTLVGGLLFGVGWALCGACPTVAFVQMGEGQLAGLVTLAGVFLGNAAYGALHARYFRWDTGSCTDG